jgi:hypothetical protein
MERSLMVGTGLEHPQGQCDPTAFDSLALRHLIAPWCNGKHKRL